MARRISETRKKRIPHDLGKTGSSIVNTNSATHRKIFQKEERIPEGGKEKTSIMKRTVFKLQTNT